MPVLRWLSDRTALSGKLPVPLLTTNGEYKCEDDDAVYVLYEYIAGETFPLRAVRSLSHLRTGI